MPYSKRSSANPIFRSAFKSPDDEFSKQGIRPVVFDILAPDMETSILPLGLKMVLHVNPTSMQISREKMIERIQTKGGFVEQHWGEGTRSISFDMATGGFMRLYSGLSNVTGGGYDTQGTRRETIAYDKFLDMLALFRCNGGVYDLTGQIVLQGIIKILFDGGIYLGWFGSFSVTESADKPYQFSITSDFTVHKEVMRFRSMPYNTTDQSVSYNTPTMTFEPEGITLTPTMTFEPEVITRTPSMTFEPEVITRTPASPGGAENTIVRNISGTGFEEGF